jgi:hypothetical protein
MKTTNTATANFVHAANAWLDILDKLDALAMLSDDTEIFTANGAITVAARKAELHAELAHARGKTAHERRFASAKR